MSLENPTRLRIGMHGNFSGRDYRVVGRSVMGETESGETYYWNEFNLETESGDEATLVYEETESGAQWRLFTQFDAEYPMTAADAATKRVGDWLNLTGENVRVTFRGASKVYRIEGKAPEGEDVGDVAEYFNAEAGRLMLVVSWTGDEVEYYNGVNLTSGMIATAFNLPTESQQTVGSRFSGGSSSGNYTSGLKFLFQAALVILIFFLVFGRNLSCSTAYEAPAVKKIPAGALPLIVGAAGKLDDKNYRITAHAVVEMAEVGARWERHEYQLTDDYGATALLVCGDKPSSREWVLFESFSPMLAPTAKQLAAKKVGDTVELDGYTGKIGEIFLATVVQSDGEPPVGLKSGAASFGVKSVNEYRILLVRWNTESIQFFRGRALPAKKVADAFNGK